MMRLITGVPGAGKSLFAVSEIIKMVKEGRKVFTNIAGMDYEGVFPLEDTDWRNYPEGSLIVYDEAHQIFRATGRPGLSNDPVISEMDMHRHRGYDLWFSTQFPGKVHHEIRRMCDEHYHLLRQFGSSRSTIYKWPEAVDSSDRSERAIADKTPFSFPKSIYKHYKSSSIHTSKVRIPSKLKFLATVVVLISSFVAYRLVSAGGFTSLAMASEAQISPAPVVIAGGAAERPGDTGGSTFSPTPAIGGCVWSARGCQCYTTKLEPIPLSDSECRTLADKPLAMSLRLGKER